MSNLKLVVGLALCWITLAYFAHRYPLNLPYSADPEISAEFILRNTGASAVMIVDTAAIRQSWDNHEFSRADFSYGWLNILERRVGRFDIVNTDQLAPELFAERALVVLTESITNSHSWNSQFQNSIAVPANTLILADLNSDTLEYQYPQGLQVIALESFARGQTELRQGRPEDDLSVVNRYSAQGSSSKLESNDLISDESLLNSNTPVADSLEIALFNQINLTNPTPGWHIVPDIFNGIFLMTHDDEGIGDKGLWMNEYESAHGYNSTTFLLPSQTLSAAGVAHLGGFGGEPALHWNRFDRQDKGSYDTLSLGPWKPLKTKRNLQAQLDWLEALGETTQYNRNHYFLWDDSYTRTFRILAAHDISMDFSYGPDLNQKGYIFGGAFPFHPLDENGAPFSLYETPVTWTENFSGADSVWIANILADNANRFHGVIAPLYHNNTYSWRPDYQIFDSWKSSYDMATVTGHKMMRVSELERFLEDRRTSELTWELSAGQLVITCTAKSSDLSVLIPEEHLGRPRVYVEIGGPDGALKPMDVPIDRINLLETSYWRIVTPINSLKIICDRLEQNIRQR